MNHAQIDILGEKITTMEEMERKVDGGKEG